MPQPTSTAYGLFLRALGLSLLLWVPGSPATARVLVGSTSERHKAAEAPCRPGGVREDSADMSPALPDTSAGSQCSWSCASPWQSQLIATLGSQPALSSWMHRDRECYLLLQWHKASQLLSESSYLSNTKILRSHWSNIIQPYWLISPFLSLFYPPPYLQLHILEEETPQLVMLLQSGKSLCLI